MLFYTGVTFQTCQCCTNFGVAVVVNANEHILPMYRYFCPLQDATFSRTEKLSFLKFSVMCFFIMLNRFLKG